MISLKILEKEYEQCVKKVERLQNELEELQQNVRVTEADIEQNMVKMQDLKSAICKLTQQ